MKGISNSFLRTICALIIGLVLVMFPNEAGDYFVITIGVVFLIPALLSIIGYFAMSAEERRRLPIEGIGSLLFGLWLIIMPGFFADLLTFVLGFILVLGVCNRLHRFLPPVAGCRFVWDFTSFRCSF